MRCDSESVFGRILPLISRCSVKAGGQSMVTVGRTGDNARTRKNVEPSVGNWMQSMDANPRKDQFGKLSCFGARRVEDDNELVPHKDCEMMAPPTQRDFLPKLPTSLIATSLHLDSAPDVEVST